MRPARRARSTPRQSAVLHRLSQAQRALLDWYSRNQRDLPWRRNPDPWPVWVSEIMCQQTRVDAVVPYFERFMKRFPGVADLAQAPLDELLGLWSGLGYYSRARHLHRAARLVVQEHGGVIPHDPAQFRALPGVGEYTAGAVLSIAFNQPLPAVDGNVRRVLSRLEDLADPRPPALRAAARTWFAAEAPGTWNQALMELGALICLPANPYCASCPALGACRAHRAGTLADRPPARRRVQVRELDLFALWDLAPGGLVVERRPEKGIWGGLWMVPLLPHRPGAFGRDEAHRQFQAPPQPGAEMEHLLTHRRIRLRLLQGRLRRPLPPGWQRVALAQLEARGKPTALDRLLDLAGAASGPMPVGSRIESRSAELGMEKGF